MHFFQNREAFRRWLEQHHRSESFLLVGFYKRDSGKPSITWPESVEEALCFGWIDGVRKRVDEESYTIRFTPRRPGSIWSRINLRKMEELIAAGRVAPAGLAVYEARDPRKEAVYSFENAPKELDAASAKQFRANREAWTFFAAQAPSYQRLAIYWVMSAKKDETRARRLERLIDSSANGVRI